jgi:hypothetical protein
MKNRNLRNEARNSFAHFASNEFYTDRQKQIFIQKYCQLKTATPTRKVEEIEQECITALKNAKILETEQKRSEFDRTGTKYQKNVRKAAKKAAKDAQAKYNRLNTNKQ